MKKVLLLICLFFLVACGKVDYTKMTKKEVLYDVKEWVNSEDETIYYTFEKNGKGIYTNGTLTYNLTWSIDNETLVLLVEKTNLVTELYTIKIDKENVSFTLEKGKNITKYIRKTTE